MDLISHGVVVQFALIFQSISELTAVFVRLGSVLMVIMVFFGQVGILLFGAANNPGSPFIVAY